MVGERHGGVVTLEETKASNVWALGVTLWELLENATQPYPHLSDREVLNHVIKEQQVKLFKPQLELPYSDRWYEVLQFCWLSPDKRATAEEVHRLLVYLRMQGQKDMEEDFDQRWDALKPNPSARQTTISHSSFPILDQFADDALRHEIDEVLTVTETSKGLSFEYVWEAAKHDHYDSSHTRSDLDTTLNYHSMFFPLSREDIQAHFPDPLSRTSVDENGNTPLGIPGIVPVFDAQKSTNGNEYYIQLEEQGDGTVGEDVTRGQDVGFASNRQDFVVLQDVRLDESSTDADFFHQSIDSKDSYLPDSHIWSSLENDSPYHTNIFTEDGSKQEDSPSWRRNYMELPEHNGNPFRDSLEVQDMNACQSHGEPFLGEASHPSLALEKGRENVDVKGLLSAEKLADNFVFLRDQGLMRESALFSSPQQSFLRPGVVHEPEEAFKMSSWDNLVGLGACDTSDASLKPAASSTSSRHELSEFPSANLERSRESLVDNETPVPSITVVDDNTLNQLPEDDSSSTTDPGLEITVSEADGHATAFFDSATTDSLCTDANIPSLDDDLETLKCRAKPAGNKTPDYFQDPVASQENKHNEDLTSNDVMSELTEDADVDLETTLSDHEESFMETSGHALGRSSLLVSGPSLDQISQDSLLEDSMSTTVPTVDISAETPDSLDSLDIHKLGEQGEELNDPIVPHNKLQPPYKISDSGYETENLESPEWNSQLDARDDSSLKNGIDVTEEEESEELAASGTLVPPTIVISGVEGVPEGQQTDGAPAEEPPVGSSYRDSAYFSDNDSDPEKRSEETTSGAPAEVTWSSDGPAVGKDVEALFSRQGSCLPAEGLTEVGDAHGVEVEESSSSHSNGDYKPQLLEDTSIDPTNEISAPSSVASPGSEPEVTPHAKLTRTYASDGLKIKEPDVEGRYLGRRDGSCLDGQEDGVDADEEDENSDDSDDDIRAYQMHSSSSESEDEAEQAVPIIVSDDSGSKNLKSLLKPTTLNVHVASPQFVTRNNSENTRRAVSFFDDVTVYLFDQETPTKELGDHSSDLNSHSPEFDSPVPTASYMNRFANSESSTDEEGGGFEWDDDFTSAAPAFLSKPDKTPISKATSSPSPAPGRTLEPSWTSSSSYSRFSISPASIASFSLTHLTDSDIEQGGSSEDGEKD